MNVVEESLINHPKQFFITIMNNEFVKSFVSTLMYNLATVVAIIVGVALFIKNSATVWYNNGGKETLLRYTQRVLLFISTTTEKLYYRVCDVTLSEVAQ